MDCCCGQLAEVKYCPVVNCTLWLFRLGKSPNFEQNDDNCLLNPLLFVGKENMSSDELSKLFKEKGWVK